MGASSRINMQSKRCIELLKTKFPHKYRAASWYYQSFIYSPTDVPVSCLKNNIKIYNKITPTIFDVMLTVHLSIFISVINQLDAQNFCFTISLFHASTCFEHMC